MLVKDLINRLIKFDPKEEIFLYRENNMTHSIVDVCRIYERKLIITGQKEKDILKKEGMP